MAKQKQRANKQAQTLYLPVHFYLVRAPALPGQIFERLSTTGHIVPEESNEQLDDSWQAGKARCYRLLRELAARPDVALALAVASPALQIGLGHLQREEETSTRQKRTYASLLRYLIRMSTRPTPFGLFSGVALGTYAEQTTACLGGSALERFRTRPDMGWLLMVLRELEKDQSLVAQLPLRLNQTAYLVGERAVLPSVDTYGKPDNRSVSLRATAPVRKVFELASQFIPYVTLADELQRAFPRSNPAQIESLLWLLWEHGFLISQLHPPLTDARPAEYVRAQLDILQGGDEMKAGLSQVLEHAHVLDQAGIGAPLDLLFQLRTAVESVLPGQEQTQEQKKGQERLPLQVDAALNLQAGKLQHSIGQAAARAAEFLLRQTPVPQGFSHLWEYRMLFLEKYGAQAEVPLLDLLSPENGLDAPSGYEYPKHLKRRPSARPLPDNRPRDEILLTLLSEALIKQNLKVELTEELQQRLQRWSPQVEQAPLSLEIYLQLHARSREAIDRGEWTAVVGRNCGSPHAGRTFGRFFDLLGEPGMTALHELAAREEAFQPEVIFAELSYLPVQARMANVAIRPLIRSYEIAIGTTPAAPPERVLSLNDLVVSIENGYFSLYSLRLGKQVRVCQSHMLNITRAPNVCRFIMEIANDGQSQLSSFDWGAAIHAPFLPRLFMRLGPEASLVLSLACWHLSADTIMPEGEGSEEVCWFRGLQQWRVPRYVYLCEMDNRLLLDLEHPLMAEELRGEVRKRREHIHPSLTLEELLPDFEHLWLQDAQEKGYFCEIVTPVLRADTGISAEAITTPSTKQKRRPRESVLASTERNRYPGEDWAYLKLYAVPTQQEALIAGPVRDVVRLLQEQELIDRWFFIRYADPDPHLRLRFHAKTEGEIAALHATLLPWSARLARLGLTRRTTLDTYEREVERYGGPAAIDLLEQVFAIDSIIVSNIIAIQYRHQLTLDSIAVAVWTLDQLFANWGWSVEQRLAWTRKAAEKYAWSAEFRKRRSLYCSLFAPYGTLQPDLAEQRTLLQQIQSQDTSLASLGTLVRKLAEAGKLWCSEDSLMSSLAHMHINRLLGVDRVQEEKAYAFWLHTLEPLVRREAVVSPNS